MATRLGPILGFRGQAEGKWGVSALLVTDGETPPPLKWGAAGSDKTSRAEAKQIHSHLGRIVWRYDLALPQGNQESIAAYTIGDAEEWRISVPARGATPDLAYASCNGFSNPRDMKRVKDKNERWVDLAAKHKVKPFHLLLMGGDQVYADSLWEGPNMKRWADQSQKKMKAAKFTEAMGREVEKFYFDLYCSRWFQAEPRGMLARIPSVMMWDDHDIFDGWGSYPDDLNNCPVYQGIFEIARRYFLVFQLQTPPEESPPAWLPGQHGFSYAHRLGEIGLVVLDMRSERSESRVLSDDSWNSAQKWMDGLKDCKHLLVMSSIPLVHPDFGIVERFLGIFPGQQEMEDDLKDHWCSRGHKAERLRFIHRLLAFSKAKNCRVTLLSGDVHVGAVGIISSERDPESPRNARVINQLTSSGIVHPPPPGMVLYFLEKVGDRVEAVDRDITVQMLEFPGTRHRFVGNRNWMGLRHDDEHRIWVDWHVAGVTEPFTKVVHPVPKA